ncbi:acylphosphatase [Phenylobacterium haematophilum]|uniref:acylphosphatase n=1 Tax=Phenylobacterium haematophilum TaxID=98513 RepID=A0A839ZZF0_9CAUL|nr:acylphosphatase [Phenylobacterium haematophilum]MBB3891995.1 acylphosphatase [Phenylobacterium haematophilum]
MERRAIRLRITGEVQGVGYRWWAERQARRLAVDGWVRNCPDGSVELLAIGDEVALERLTEACRGGPPTASVAGVQTLAADDDGSLGFAARS